MTEQNPPKRFTALRIWALSLGCSVGWGAFVLPGTVFLPLAGPLGSTLAIFFGALAMLVVGANFHYMAQRYPDSGGAYSYVRGVLGEDHAFLCAWFLWLVYAAIVWANASAFSILVRNFGGDILQFGGYYTIAGCNIYFGEVFFSCAILLVCAWFFIHHNRSAILVNTLFAIMIVVGACSCFGMISEHVHDVSDLAPAFLPNRSASFQIFNIFSFAPWAYVGFESVSHIVPEMTGSRKQLFWIMTAAVLTAAVVYSALNLIAAVPMHDGVNWSAYAQMVGEGNTKIRMLDMPVFHAVREFLGQKGLTFLAIAVLGAVGTGLFGFNIAISRLTCKLSDEGVLPAWFGKRTEQNVPKNAFIFMLGLSILMMFAGRTAIVWIVDINSICATLVYTYVSVVTLISARSERNGLFECTGVLGILIGIAFCIFSFLPNIWSINSLSTESYIIFAFWGVLGFVFYLYLFKKDPAENYGRSTFVWIVMIFMIFVSSLMWMRQDMHESTIQLVEKVSNYYITHSIDELNEDTQKTDKQFYLERKNFLDKEMSLFSRNLTKHSIIQMMLIMLSVSILFVVYSMMHVRRRKLELEKVKAEEISKSKSAFLSNMSHDIRTPINAIIGFTDLALTKNDINVVHDYLTKVKVSSNHLLSLINDVLEMSRIESGRVELQETVVHLPELLHNLNSIILGQIQAKQQDFDINAFGVHNEVVVCDKLRLNQILLNLLSNAIKYTPVGGRISVKLSQKPAENGVALYELRVKDNGIGMSPEFAARIFEAFERENTSTVNKIQGTGLGMSITKHLVDLMHGTIELQTEKGKGSEFILNFRFPIKEKEPDVQTEQSLDGLHALVVDDDYASCDSLTGMLTEMGIRAEWTMTGKEAILRYNDAMKRGDRFDLCVIDWKMPDMSGVHVAQEICESKKDCKPSVILVTAYDWLNIKDEAQAAGVTAFCDKPVFGSELHQAVLTALGRQDAVHREQTKAVDERNFEGKRLLLVDDIDVNREIGVALLSMHGFEVEEAVDGQDAVDKVAGAAPGYYDMIFMDVQMPKLNGYEATKAIRALDRARAKVPIVAMTANAFDEDRQEALDNGMDGHLAKPIDMERVLKLLSEHL